MPPVSAMGPGIPLSPPHHTGANTFIKPEVAIKTESPVAMEVQHSSPVEPTNLCSNSSVRHSSHVVHPVVLTPPPKQLSPQSQVQSNISSPSSPVLDRGQ